MNWKTLFKSFKSRDMRNRIFAVIGILLVYRFLAHVPIPLAEPTHLKEAMEQALTSNSFGGFMNLLSGGALTSMSIVLIGLAPYITSSIFMQMLAKSIPRMEELRKDGESGMRRINQWTRIIALPIAIFQSIAYVVVLRSGALGASVSLGDMTTTQWLVSVSAMATGAMLMMWLGEIITEKGIGNGITMLIVVGILSQMPKTIGTMWAAITTPNGDPFHLFNWFQISGLNHTATWLTVGLTVIGIMLLYFLVKINEGQRIVKIDYARRVRGNSQYGNVQSILPMKLITAGVIPVIFAVAFLALPAFLGQLMIATKWNPDLGRNLIIWFQRDAGATGSITGLGAMIYPVCFFLLVVVFTYFYTSIAFNSKQIAEQMQQQDGFIENVRPGRQTEKYLSRTINRLTLFGAIALGLISVMPFVGEAIMFRAGLGSMAAGISLGGTGLIIIVTGALDCLRQLNSRGLMVAYDEYK